MCTTLKKKANAVFLGIATAAFRVILTRAIRFGESTLGRAIFGS